MTIYHIPELVTGSPQYKKLKKERNKFKRRIIQLEADLEEERELRERLGDILEQTANALKGKPESLHLHDWSDLPEIAKQLKAKVEGK